MRSEAMIERDDGGLGRVPGDPSRLAALRRDLGIHQRALGDALESKRAIRGRVGRVGRGRLGDQTHQFTESPLDRLPELLGRNDGAPDRAAVWIGHTAPDLAHRQELDLAALLDELFAPVIRQPADPAIAGACEQPQAFVAQRLCGLVRPGTRQDVAALSVGRRRGDRHQLASAATDRPDLDVGHGRPGLLDDPPGQVIRPRPGRILDRGSDRRSRPGEQDGRDRRGGREEGGDEQGQPREEHHLDHPFRQR